jgi:hypothetical protein
MLGAAGGMALGASCILPSATVVETGASDTSVVPVLLAQGDAGVVVAPSGNGTQRHLIYASGQWWAFYPTSSVVAVTTSPDFRSWAPNPGTSGKSSTLSYDVAPPAGQVDGRTFGVDTESIGGTSVVHLSLSGSTMTSNRVDHARAVISTDTGLGFDSSVAMAIDGVYSGQVDGTVTLIAEPAPFHVFDFVSLSYPDAGDSWVLSAGNTDDGETNQLWMGDFTLTALPDGLGSAVPIRGAVALAGYIAVLWPSQSNLLWSERLLSEPASAWSTPTQVGASATTMGGRDWGLCAEPGVQKPVAHLLATDDTGFHHFENTNGTSWTPQQHSPPSLGAPPSELFLACGAGRVYAFAIGATTPGYPIQETVWDASTDAWSDWGTVVAPAPAPSQRCYLAGFDRVVDGVGIGLLWTESDNCNEPAPLQLYGVLVPP